MLLLYDELDSIIRENNKFEAYDLRAQEAAAKALNRQLMVSQLELPPHAHLRVQIVESTTLIDDILNW